MAGQDDERTPGGMWRTRTTSGRGYLKTEANGDVPDGLLALRRC
jgi:hypothetical protein